MGITNNIVAPPAAAVQPNDIAPKKPPSGPAMM